MSETLPLLVWQDGPIGRVRLNRPRALNALTRDMAQTLSDTLLSWRDDDSISAIVIDAAGGKAFCAGGDILDLYTVGKSGDPEPGRAFWREEYRLNALIASYPKPYVAVMDGITMGGGVGISAHGSHRIVTERTMLAMPETGIGFLPDVGGTYLLSRAPGKIGLYLGMTGTRMGPADAIYAGFADHFIASDRLPEFIATLADGTPLAEALQTYSSPPPEGKLAGLQDKVDIAFGQTTAVDCAKKLAEMAAAGDNWAEKTHSALRRNAPLSVAAAFEAINMAKQMNTIEDCLALEYRFAHRALIGQDFYEGVRAAVIDKDKNPKWDPSTLETVSPESVAAMLSSLGADEWTAA